jgi:hypothetical protein
VALAALEANVVVYHQLEGGVGGLLDCSPLSSSSSPVSFSRIVVIFILNHDPPGPSHPLLLGALAVLPELAHHVHNPHP